MRTCLLYIGTEDGLFVFRFDGGLELVGRGLQGNAVRGIAIHPDDPRLAYIACGLRGWGLHRTWDAGQTFEVVGFEDRWVWGVAVDPIPADTRPLYVGTEPPMLYVSHDQGDSFEAFDEIQRLPSRPQWKFFHQPFYAGHIHGIALSRDRAGWIYAGVEHGALIYTHDGGRTWKETLVGYDLHRVALDPTNPLRVFAGAGEGLFVSEDAGCSWQVVPELSGRYVHAILFDERRPHRMYVYVAEDGRPLYRSLDGGRNWHPIGQGLPAARPADSLSTHPTDPDVLFYGGDVDSGKSRVFLSTDQGEAWEPLSKVLPKIWRLRAVVAP